MKTRLNLTIDDVLLEHIKVYAMKQQTSVSELVENYFKSVVKPARRKNIISMVDKLEKPVLKAGVDLKELYYEAKGKKYGL